MLSDTYLCEPYLFVIWWIDITQIRYQMHSLHQKSHMLLKKTRCKRELWLCWCVLSVCHHVTCSVVSPEYVRVTVTLKKFTNRERNSIKIPADRGPLRDPLAGGVASLRSGRSGTWNITLCVLTFTSLKANGLVQKVFIFWAVSFFHHNF